MQLKSATGAISINGFRLKKEHYVKCMDTTYLISNIQSKKIHSASKQKKGQIIYCLNVRRNRKLRKFSNPFRCVGAFCMRIVHVFGYQCAHSPSQKRKYFYTLHEQRLPLFHLPYIHVDLLKGFNRTKTNK